MNLVPISLETELRESLERRYGPLLTGASLRQALGYPSAAAYRQARRRQQLPVTVFCLPNRRGSFALTLEVAAWLARSRHDRGNGGNIQERKDAQNVESQNQQSKEDEMS